MQTCGVSLLTDLAARILTPLPQHSALGDIIGAYPLRAGLSDEEIARERLLRQCFTDFLLGECTLSLHPALLLGVLICRIGPARLLCVLRHQIECACMCLCNSLKANDPCTMYVFSAHERVPSVSQACWMSIRPRAGRRGRQPSTLSLQVPTAAVPVFLAWKLCSKS